LLAAPLPFNKPLRELAENKFMTERNTVAPLLDVDKQFDDDLFFNFKNDKDKIDNQPVHIDN